MPDTHYNLDYIKQHVSILDVARDQGQSIRRSGMLYKALCPFHSDGSMGSFFLYPNNNSCACFSCNKGGTVIDYYCALNDLDPRKPEDLRAAVQYLGDRFLKNDPSASKQPPKRDLPPPPETFHLRLEMVRTTLTAYDRNTLLQYLSTIFPPADVVRTAYRYLIGTMRDGSTIFWYRTYGENTIRTGKIIRYLPDGHRDRTFGGSTIPSKLAYHDAREAEKISAIPDESLSQFNAQNFWLPRWSANPHHTYEGYRITWQPRTTLFGEHLLHDPDYRDAPVCIVESEKSALICALHEPQYLWLATGGKNFLREERIAALQQQGRTIYLFPDRDAYEDITRINPKSGKETIDKSWPHIAETFQYREHIFLSTDLLEYCQELGITDPKCDIADIYLILRQQDKQS